MSPWSFLGLKWSMPPLEVAKALCFTRLAVGDGLATWGGVGRLIFFSKNLLSVTEGLAQESFRQNSSAELYVHCRSKFPKDLPPGAPR